MSGSDTLRPDANISVGGGWAPTGAGTVWSALSDADDGTYATNSTSYSRCVIALDNPSWPAEDIRITGVQLQIRAERLGAASKLSVTSYFESADDPDTDEFTLTTSPADYTGKVRARQPNGKLWTKEHVESLGVTFKTASGEKNTRVYSVAVIVTWVIEPEVTVTAPTGTQIVSQPTVTWDFTHEDGLKQNNLHVRVFEEDVYTDGGFDPATSTAIYDTGPEHSQDQTRVIRTDLTNGTYQAWVRAGIQLLGFPLWSNWESVSFTVDFDEASAPIVTVGEDVPNGRVNLVVTGTDNLLGGQEASLEAESGTGYWVGENCTLTRVNSDAFHGAWSLRLTASSAADCSIVLGYYLRCRPGQSYQLQAQLKALTTGRNTQFELLFYDASFNLIDTDTSPNTADTTSDWTLPPDYSAPAPSNATWMKPRIRIKSPSNGEQHLVDAIKLAALISDFSRGGLVDRNLLSRNQSALETDASGWNTTGATVIARSTTTAKSGSASLRLTAPGGFAASAVTDEGVDGVPIVPGIEYTAIASVRAGTTVRPCQIGLRFYDADGNMIDSQRGDYVTDSASNWNTQVTVSHVAPAGAVTAAALVVAGNNSSIPAASELHYFDEISISVDPSASWAPGGTKVGSTAPSLQFTDDPAGTDATWAPLISTPLVFGRYQDLSFVDNTAPATGRRYRARVVAVEDGDTIASTWSDIVDAALPSSVYRLKKPFEPDFDIPFTDPDGCTRHPRKMSERAAFFDPLGEDFPVKVSDGMSGEDGELELVVYGDTWTRLKELLRTTGTLLLVDPFGEQWFIAWEPDSREIDIADTEPGPERTVSAAYRQVARP